MQNPRRAEENENYSESEQEERRLHGYHQELDRDRDGVPDYLQEENDAAYEREGWRKNDRNNNGIPDHLEIDKPGGRAANDDCLPYTAEAHRNSSLDKGTRQAAGIAAATAEPAHGASELSKKVAAASAAASQEIRKDESNPKKGEFGKGAVHDRMEKLRKKRVPKSSKLGDLSRANTGKADPDDELAPFKGAWKGLVAARQSMKQDKKAAENAKIDQELRELEKNERELDRKEAQQARADNESRRVAKGEEPEVEGASKDNEAKDIAKDADKKVEGADRDPVKEAREAALEKGDSKESAPKAEAAPQSERASQDPAQPTSAEATKSGAQPPANDRAVSQPERAQSLDQTPSVQGGPSRERALSGVEAPAAQRSPMLEQARGLKMPDAPVAAKGPANPAPRMRAMGLGNGIAMMTKAFRKEIPNETSLEIQHAAQKQRDSGGRGR